jgi:hypothetical protein
VQNFSDTLESGCANNDEFDGLVSAVMPSKEEYGSGLYHYLADGCAKDSKLSVCSAFMVYYYPPEETFKHMMVFADISTEFVSPIITVVLTASDVTNVSTEFRTDKRTKTCQRMFSCKLVESDLQGAVLYEQLRHVDSRRILL